MLRSNLNQQALTYATTDRKGYRTYKSNAEICKDCPMLSQCTRSKNKQKVITRHVWEESKEWVRMNRLSKSGKALYSKRKETIERSITDAKELHGFRYCRLKGRKKVLEQALLTAACQTEHEKDRNLLGQDGLENEIFYILIANRTNSSFK